MLRRLGRVARAVVVGTLLLVGIAAATWLAPVAKRWLDSHRENESPETIAIRDKSPRSELDPQDENTLIVPGDVLDSLKVTFSEVVHAPPPEPLKIDGSLYLDANRLVHVRTRFSGELMELGTIEDVPSTAQPTATRPVRFGDRVAKGQLLAVVWSKDLGEKKSELAERITQLRLDEEKLKRLEELIVKGSTSDQNVRSARRDVEGDLIAVSRAERTLRSWRLSETEIQAIRAEAEELRRRHGQWDKKLDDTWARVEVRAPIEGTILEKNVAVGDFANTEQDLFKIADLSRLDVLAQVYEEDIPDLELLAPAERRWEIVLKADPKANPLLGSFEQIGNVIDPNQHTALVMGWVDNSRHRLRVGQFVTARVMLPASPHEVAIPVSAVIDSDDQSLVFVRSPNDRTRLACRRVYPVHRRDNLIYVTDIVPPGKVKSGLPYSTLRPGEQVMSSAGVEFAAEWQNLIEAKHLKAAASSHK